MENSSSSSFIARVERELSNLKIVSRLLGHELHSQSGQRITMSRDQVTELQTSIDLFIEEVQRNRSSSGMGSLEGAPLPSRMN